MILLDTNVVSELMRSAPNPNVVQWLNKQNPSALFLSCTVLSELYVGIEIMPSGKRQQALRTTLQAIQSSLLTNPVLQCDEMVASFQGKLTALAQTKGVQVKFADGQIAATALQHGFTVATRDTTPFQAAGVKVINPWV